MTDAPSPRPSSTRPSDTKSSVAIFSATRAGWFVVICTMPWPRRMFLVRWLAAARKTSGAEECEYSSRKWCSTSPRVVEAQLVGQLDLRERVLQQLVFAVRAPVAR